MDEDFARQFKSARRIVLASVLVFFSSAIGFAVDGYYLDGHPSPGIIPTYALALLLGVGLGTLPVMHYLLVRHLKRATSAVVCPLCHRPLWWNTVVAIQTALLSRCPACFKSLRQHQGFPVIPPAGTSPEERGVGKIE